MILGPLPSWIGDLGDQAQRDVEKSATEIEPLGSLIGPCRCEVQPGECRRKNVLLFPRAGYRDTLLVAITWSGRFCLEATSN
jgi:hypothetical protein